MFQEVFTGARGKYTPSVTINKNGSFGFSSGFHRKYIEDKYVGIQLFYSKENNTIGIKLTESESAEGCIRIKKRDNKTGAFAMAKSFFSAYYIEIETVSGKYSPKEFTDPKFGEMFILDLNEKK